MPGEQEPVDEGLAHERTDLAWNRTGLAVAVCIAVLLRRLWPLRGADQVVALACMSAGALAWAVALWAGRTVGHRAPAYGTRSGTELMSRHRAAGITVGTLALAVAAFALALFPPS